MTGSLKIAKLDFFTMRSQSVMYLLLAIILLELGAMGLSITGLGINGAWFIALMSINIFAIQEKNDLDRLYGSVSVRWKEVVAGRYIFVFLSYIIAFFMSVVICLCFSQFQNKTLDLQEIAIAFSLSFFVYSIIIVLQIPMLFLVGYTKARAWALLPYLIVIGLIAAPPVYSFILRDAANFQNPLFLSMLSQYVEFIKLVMLKKGTLIIGGILAGCIIQLISFRLSIAAYRKHR